MLFAWDTNDYFQVAVENKIEIGYVFTCPACNETLDMVFRTLPFSDEFRKQCIDKYKYDPQDNVWDQSGKLEEGNLSLHPSIVHMGCSNGGHYWIRDGKIFNC